MNKLISLICLTVASLLIGKVVVAQQTPYPIKELGNCQNLTQCYSFCEIPENHAACWSYGQFVQSPQVLAATSTAITFPIAELGNCDSFRSCAAFCDQSQNRPACKDFATAHGMSTSIQKPVSSLQQQRLLEEAKSLLGCNSFDSCKTLCSQTENRTKCLEFARKIKQATSNQPLATSFTVALFASAKLELGCDSEFTCKDLCSKTENHQKCRLFAQKHNLGNISGKPSTLSPTASPSALPCSDKTSCKKFCADNPGVCPPILLRYLEMLPANVTFSSTDSGLPSLPAGTCSNTLECYKFCLNNPDKCPGFPRPQSTLKSPLPPTTTDPYPSNINPSSASPSYSYPSNTTP